jgi:hypothetical protein
LVRKTIETRIKVLQNIRIICIIKGIRGFGHPSALDPTTKLVNSAMDLLNLLTRLLIWIAVGWFIWWVTD